MMTFLIHEDVPGLGLQVVFSLETVGLTPQKEVMTILFQSKSSLEMLLHLLQVCPALSMSPVLNNSQIFNNTYSLMLLQDILVFKYLALYFLFTQYFYLFWLRLISPNWEKCTKESPEDAFSIKIKTKIMTDYYFPFKY